MMKTIMIVKKFASKVAFPLGLATCILNSMSGNIGMENIYMTAMSLLAFEAAR